MKGTTKLILNQETVMAAIQKYFTQSVFDASQLATVTAVIPILGFAGDWTYEVTIDSDAKDESQ